MTLLFIVFGNRAYAAYISGILLNVVGFAGATGRSVPLAATRIYQMSFFTGFSVSALVYLVLNALSPVPGKSPKFEEVDMSKDDDLIEEVDGGHYDRRESGEKSVEKA